MSVATAVLGAAAVWFLVLAWRPTRLTDRVASYVMPQVTDDAAGDGRVAARLVGAVPWMVVGCLVGLLLAQGDLFLSGAGRSAPALGVLGAAAGWFVHSAVGSNAQARRESRFRNELPAVVDSVALQLVSGESVASALRNVVEAGSGVAVDEISVVLSEADDIGLEQALLVGGRVTAHSDGRRLYETLAHAHSFGGRVADSLTALASDYRAALERDLAAQGGRKAVTSYGPVLALMVPTALLFLLYPTLLGLRALSGAP